MITVPEDLWRNQQTLEALPFLGQTGMDRFLNQGYWSWWRPLPALSLSTFKRLFWALVILHRFQHLYPILGIIS